MASSLETFRRGQLRFGDPLDWHPINHMTAKDIREKQKKGHNRNAEKAMRRRERELLRRHTLQFQKALGHMLGGHDDMDTPEARDALLTIGKHEKVIDTYHTGHTGKKTTVTIAIVKAPYSDQ